MVARSRVVRRRRERRDGHRATRASDLSTARVHLATVPSGESSAPTDRADRRADRAPMVREVVMTDAGRAVRSVATTVTSATFVPAERPTNADHVRGTRVGMPPVDHRAATRGHRVATRERHHVLATHHAPRAPSGAATSAVATRLREIDQLARPHHRDDTSATTHVIRVHGALRARTTSPESAVVARDRAGLDPRGVTPDPRVSRLDVHVN